MSTHTITVFLFIFTFVMSACGTFEVGVEPAVSGAEIARSEPEEVPLETTVPAAEETTSIQETTVPAAEETASMVEAIPTTAMVAGAGETVQPLTTPSEITELDETWNQFTDYRLGFSIKFPKEMATLRGSCARNEGQGSYRPEMALVPVQIFEDADAVYIASEYYYELAGERTEAGRTFYGECNPVINSLQLLRDPENWNEPYWKLVVEEVRDDGELDSFIKARYGPGCSLGERTASNQDGVDDVGIQGDGKSLEETACPLNFGTVVKYYPAGNKVIAWDTGQAYTFPADVNYSVTHDDEMVDSFHFLTETSMETAVEPDLDSSATGSTQDGPVTELNTYTNSEYGFALNYPSTWTAAEVNDGDFVGPGSRSVQLSQGTVKLVIGYRRSGENVAIGGSGAPAGEFETRGTVQVVGQDVERVVIVFEGKDKAVMYGQPGSLPLSAGGLEFALRMDDFAQAPYEDIDLSQAVQDEADMILSSITFSP